MAMNMNRRSVLQAASGIAALPLLGLGSRVAFGADGEITVRIEKDISNLDPANRVGAVEDNIIISVCQTLARFKPGTTLEWEPDAAKTITQVSETEIAFELNPGQMFSGGYGELTAEDVKFSYERFKPSDDGKKAAYADDWAALDHVEVTGKYTGRILFKNPAPAIFVIGICDGSGGLLSKKAVGELGDKIATTLIGSGPYLIKEWKPNDHLTLEVNPDYKGNAPAPYQRIILKPIQEWQTALLAFQAKEVAFTEIEPTAVARDREGSRCRPHQAGRHRLRLGRHQCGEAAVRQSEGAPGDPLRHRRRRHHRRRVFGHGVAREDPAGAAAARPLGGRAGLSVRPGQGQGAAGRGRRIRSQMHAHLSQRCAHAGGRPDHPGQPRRGRRHRQHQRAGWRRLLGPRHADKSKDLELTIIPYSSKTDPGFQTQWFVSSQVTIWNWQRWKNPEFDKLHAEAGSITDQAERAKKYIRMQQLLDESASCIWITHGVHDFAHAKSLVPAILPNGNNWQYRFFKPA